MRARVGAARVARLATLTAGAKEVTPHLVPITFALRGDVLYTAVDWKPKAGPQLRRLDNIAANPRVAVMVDRYADDWGALWWIRMDGTARVLEPGFESTEAIDALCEKYEQYAERRPDGPVTAITVIGWTGWTARA